MSKVDTKRRKTGTDAFNDVPLQIRQAAQAAQDKKAIDLTVLDLRELSSFTDFFVICTAQNARQVKAIADAVESALLKAGTRPAHVEGYDRAEWVLLDYFDFIVHVFTPATREFYALDRLWGSAERIAVPEPAANQQA
jgi:ribosome-associated protein